MADLFVPILDTSAWQFPGYNPRRGTIPDQTPAPDLHKAAAAGIAGIIHRVSNGARPDPAYRLVLDAATFAGLRVGAYHYLQPVRQTAAESATAVLDLVRRGPRLDLPIMADCEHFDGQDTLDRAAFGRWFAEWLDRVEAGTGRRPIRYTGRWWWNAEAPAEFGDLDTILARYPANDAIPPADPALWAEWAFRHGPTGPALPAGETAWDGWQFTSSGDAAAYGFAQGVRIDCNLIRPESWRRWTTSTSPDPDPNPVDPSPPAVDFTAGRYGAWPTRRKPTIARGASGDAVRYAQAVIRRTRSRKLAVDGVFGPVTDRAVRSYQRARGLTVDGVVGPVETWPAIDRDATRARGAK